ncbi:MAG: sugar transferase, partial [Planctomycetes bacterium]|nr:sugar transferase [Planctomycetota bacterium]
MSSNTSSPIPAAELWGERHERWTPWRILLGRLGAIVLLLAAAPVIGLACLLVRLTSPGPAIYRQVRLGAGGRAFVLYKIRTMVVDAERKTGAVWASANDPRVTPLGRVLRALHIDELPQLVNVIRGY